MSSHSSSSSSSSPLSAVAGVPSSNEVAKLKYQNLGKTGLKVSEICLGAMTFGENQMGIPTTDEATSFAMMDHFVSVGGNFIDTADIYGNGTSERIIGKWLQSKEAGFRETMIIATKCRGTMGPNPNDAGLSRKHIFDAVEGSLKRLQTNYIDLYQVHWLDNATPIKETLSALSDLVRSGKVRYIGVSNFTGWQLQKALCTSEALGLEKFVCLQPEYNLLSRSLEWELLPLSKEEGLGVIPWSPLASGWLSGKYKRGMKEPPKGSRIEWAEQKKYPGLSWSSKGEEKTWAVIDELGKVAEELKASHAQVALRWVMQQPGITAPIIGAKNMEQLKDNLAAAFIKLSEDQMKRLNTVSSTDLPYPYAFLKMVGQF